MYINRDFFEVYFTTPRKINMEPKHHPIEIRKIIWTKPPFSGSMLIFQGVRWSDFVECFVLFLEGRGGLDICGSIINLTFKVWWNKWWVSLCVGIPYWCIPCHTIYIYMYYMYGIYVYKSCRYHLIRSLPCPNLFVILILPSHLKTSTFGAISPNTSHFKWVQIHQ